MRLRGVTKKWLALLSEPTVSRIASPFSLKPRKTSTASRHVSNFKFFSLPPTFTTAQCSKNGAHRRQRFDESPFRLPPHFDSHHFLVTRHSGMPRYTSPPWSRTEFDPFNVFFNLLASDWLNFESLAAGFSNSKVAPLVSAILLARWLIRSSDRKERALPAARDCASGRSFLFF